MKIKIYKVLIDKDDNLFFEVFNNYNNAVNHIKKFFMDNMPDNYMFNESVLVTEEYMNSIDFKTLRNLASDMNCYCNITSTIFEISQEDEEEVSQEDEEEE